MASIAVLPVLIGLAVDYAIQFQARFDEQRARARATADAPRPRPPRRPAGPTIVTAGVATAVGFLVLLLSPVPMVRGFGALLVLGIGLALACALCAGFAALVRFGGRRGRGAAGAAAARARRWPRWARIRAWRARASGWPTAPGARSACALARPRRVLAIGLAVAVVGLGARHPERGGLRRARARARRTSRRCKDVNELQEETGVSGEIDVTVRADDITDPR